MRRIISRECNRQHPLLTRAFTLVLLGSLGSVTSGCATFRGTQTPGLVLQQSKGASIPRVLTPSPRIQLVLHHEHTLGETDAGSQVTAATEKQFRASLLKVAKEFPFLERASFEDTSADYRLVLDTVNAEKGSETQALITGATLLLIPMKTGATFDLKGTVYRGTQKLKTYQATGDVNIIMHAIFLLPFAWRPSLPVAILEDTYRDLFLQMQRELPQLFSAGGG